MYGVAAANLQSILMILMRLAALFVWASISGWVLDLANNTGFGNDKKLIDGGNVAVAISRTGGFAALVLGGALLLAQI